MNLTSAMGIGIFLLGAAGGAMLTTLQRAAQLRQLRSLQADQVSRIRESRFRGEPHRRHIEITPGSSAGAHEVSSVDSDELSTAMREIRSLERQNVFLLRASFDKN
jgi:hypothetical protein